MNTSDFFVEQGAGEPVVFVHGSYATTSTWKKLMERLAPTHHCIAIRLPGHGGLPTAKRMQPGYSNTMLTVVCSTTMFAKQSLPPQVASVGCVNRRLRY